jgi:hypothetical protein
MPACYDTRVRSFTEWMSDGEMGAEAIYQQSIKGFAAVVGAGALLALIPAFRHWYIAIIYLCIAIRALAERRRAYIFTGSSVVYRPAFGSVTDIRFDDVLSIRETTAVAPFLLRPLLVRGASIQTGQKTISLPLDFHQEKEIWQRLLAESKQ